MSCDKIMIGGEESCDVMMGGGTDVVGYCDEGTNLLES